MIQSSRWANLAAFVTLVATTLLTHSIEAMAQEEAAQPITNAAILHLDGQLKDIVSIRFDGATIEEATAALTLKSKELDSAHKGINFNIDPEASKSAKPISLTLENVPLREALRYICELARVKFKVEDYAVSIIPFNRNTGELISRTFYVGPSFVEPPRASTTVTNP